LERELKSASLRLALSSEVLTTFRALAEKMERRFWEGDQTEATEALDAVQTTFGESLWLIESKIALKQLYGGLEVQKRFAKEVQSKSRRGVAGYFAYYMSVKHEPTVNPIRFSEDTATRLRRSKLPQSGNVYLNLRLGDTWPTTEVGLAHILQVEHTTTLIDLYETLIRVIQRLATREPGDALAIIIKSVINDLSAIEDFRLTKLSMLLAPNTYEMPQSVNTSLSATDLLLKGHLGRSLSPRFAACDLNPLNYKILLPLQSPWLRRLLGPARDIDNSTGNPSPTSSKDCPFYF
jgi:hypothetical protein